MSTNPLQILIIDDNQASAQTLGWAIEMEGGNVQIANSGQEAINIASSLKPNVVILDIGLPDISGFEVCKILKEMPELTATSFIAQTGWSEEKYRNLAKEAGFHHYLLKPVDLKLLQKLVFSSVTN